MTADFNLDPTHLIDLGRLTLIRHDISSFGLTSDDDGRPIPADTPFVVCDSTFHTLTVAELAHVRREFGLSEIPQQDNVVPLKRMSREAPADPFIRDKHDAINNPRSCLNKAADGEPVFIIRGADPVGAATIRHWERMRREMGDVETAKLADALTLADMMDAWPHKKQLP